MPDIPWDVIGAGGGFALLVLIIVFAFLNKWAKNMKEEIQKESKARCCDNPEVKKAIERNLLMAESLKRVETNTEIHAKESIKQTTLLKIFLRKLNGGPFELDL